VVPTLHMASVMKLVPREQIDPNDAGSVMTALNFPQQGTPYVAQLAFLTSSLGAPCVAPPWGRLSAIDMKRGEILWQVPLGSIENLGRGAIGAFKEKLSAAGWGWLAKIIPVIGPDWDWGTPQAGGPIVTRGGVVFIAASADDKFRAFDLPTGDKLWETRLPAGGQATPMTYAVNGVQYVVQMAGGHPYYGTTPGDHIVAYRLAD
jgi:quinoprotein glucose dehydrogenase